MFSWAFSTSETMSPMPRMRPAIRSGWNSSIASSFSPTPMNLIGLPVIGLGRERRTAARVRVEFGQDHAVEFEPLVERLGGVDRVLAGHRVQHEVNLMRLRGGGDLADLSHQFVVDRQSAGRVENHDVAIELALTGDGVAAHSHRTLVAPIGMDRARRVGRPMHSRADR
jgi:hypothetical protein